MYAAVYVVPLRLVGRLSVDFLLVIIELFVGCYESIDWNSAALKGMREFGKTVYIYSLFRIRMQQINYKRTIQNYTYECKHAHTQTQQTYTPSE